MKGLFLFIKLNTNIINTLVCMRGMKSSQQKVLLRQDLLKGANNSNIFSLSVVRKRLQWKYKLIMILPLWQRAAWMGLVRFQWGLPKSVYDIPLNRDRNKWFKLQFCILYKQNWITAILLHYIYYSIKYGGDEDVHRAKT